MNVLSGHNSTGNNLYQWDVMKNNKLMDAAIRLYHKREREQIERCFKFIETRKPFENTNADKIWFWAIKRWPKDFSYREYELRD